MFNVIVGVAVLLASISVMGFIAYWHGYNKGAESNRRMIDTLQREEGFLRAELRYYKNK